MNYTVSRQAELIKVEVEESFTLIDFILLIVCFLAGIFFALFLWLFAAAVLIKVFTKRECVFDTDRYAVIVNIKIFNYFRLKMREIPFGEIRQVLLSDHNSGLALLEKGTVNKEWFTLELITGDRPVRIFRVEDDELNEAYELYEEIEEGLDLYFKFVLDIGGFETNNSF